MLGMIDPLYGELTACLSLGTTSKAPSLLEEACLHRPTGFLGPGPATAAVEE